MCAPGAGAWPFSAARRVPIKAQWRSFTQVALQKKESGWRNRVVNSNVILASTQNKIQRLFLNRQWDMWGFSFSLSWWMNISQTLATLIPIKSLKIFSVFISFENLHVVSLGNSGYLPHSVGTQASRKHPYISDISEKNKTSYISKLFFFLSEVSNAFFSHGKSFGCTL